MAVAVAPTCVVPLKLKQKKDTHHRGRDTYCINQQQEDTMDKDVTGTKRKMDRDNATNKSLSKLRPENMMKHIYHLASQ